MKTLRLLAVLLFAGCAARVWAQPIMPPPDQRPLERIEQLKKVRMIEMLDLKEDQSVRFFARMNDHDKVRRDLRRQKNEVLDRIERLVRNHADQKDFEKEFPDVFAIDTRIAEENRRFFDSLSDILTPEQRGKYLLFERRFESELREAIREVRHRHQMESEQPPPQQEQQ